MAAPHRNYVYKKLLLTGVAPSWADFMRDLGLSRAEATQALETLAAAHDVVLLPNQRGAGSSYVLMAHPFSNLATNHAASLERGAVTAALDGLGCDDSSTLSDPIRRFGN